MRFGIRTWFRERSRAIRGLDRMAVAALTLPVGQIRLDESRFLGELVSSLRGPGPIVEVGTLFGWSTRVMTLFKERDRELITVDNYGWNPLGLPPERHRSSTSESLAEAVRSHNVRIVARDKASFYETYAGPPPALVFLDAVHSYEQTKADIDWARRVDAGVICLHDYSPEHPGVVQAVDEAGGPARLVQSLAVLP
jgi:predicted O-methyltransferase YrrM